MNETVKSILERRSVRSFTEENIPKEWLELLAQAALSAPSARNSQKWKFTVIQNKTLLHSLARAVANASGRGEEYDFYKPDAMIIATYERDYPYGREDCSCALENIFLAAHSLGLGSVWINQLCDTCDNEEVRSILTQLNIPSSHVAGGAAALGYPAVSPASPAKDKSKVEFIF